MVDHLGALSLTASQGTQSSYHNSQHPQENVPSWTSRALDHSPALLAQRGVKVLFKMNLELIQIDTEICCMNRDEKKITCFQILDFKDSSRRVPTSINAPPGNGYRSEGPRVDDHYCYYVCTIVPLQIPKKNLLMPSHTTFIQDQCGLKNIISPHYPTKIFILRCSRLLDTLATCGSARAPSEIWQISRGSKSPKKRSPLPIPLK